MNLIALDTSTEYCSVALRCGETVLCAGCVAGQRHSELLLPMLDGLLREADMTLAQLGGVAYGAGPGSFTGLRIACSIAQGLAFAADVPVVGVSTLLALAQGQPGEQVVACLDARMGEIYHAAYWREGAGWRTVCEPGVSRPEHAPPLTGAGWTGCGSGFAAYPEQLQACYAGQLQRVDAAAVPHARHIAALAAVMLAQGEGVAAGLAAPTYLRDKVALKMHER